MTQAIGETEPAEAGLYALTSAILANPEARARFCRLDVHDEADQGDRLWLEYTPDNPVSEGSYISITQDGSSCYVCHDAADNFGGHPTFWDCYGTEVTVKAALLTYLADT
ncbi:MAG: hypothetical protein BGP10_04280 [Rhodanobacter sp. 68-29]|nr:hypothetical protein [Rhodanobacter sp.]OJY61727.1 MAG: hypothetical protein BGP10_04280 [Rhodanobacter sp. 68-29]